MIGIFDSGFGGLTILKSIRQRLPEYDYLYLGDNARAPYGTRSFEVVYEYTWQAVSYLFSQGCPLVILACNTASAKALRSIQQQNLPAVWAEECVMHDRSQHSTLGSQLSTLSSQLHRVLGVIRPTAEVIGSFTKTNHVGVLATEGTVRSDSYPLEIAKLFPDIVVRQQACPMWVPLIENNEHDSAGADYFVSKYIDSILSADPLIDTLLLGCTHYPLLLNKIEDHLSTLPRWRERGGKVLTQGALVADSLADYLRRHPDIEQACTRGGTVTCLTTESSQRFSDSAAIFLSEPVSATHVEL